MTKDSVFTKATTCAFNKDKAITKFEANSCSPINRSAPVGSAGLPEGAVMITESQRDHNMDWGFHGDG